MTWSVVFEAPAQAEIAEAFEWYEEKSYGLGGDFLRVVAAATEMLSRSPESFAPTMQAFDACCCDASLTPCIFN